MGIVPDWSGVVNEVNGILERTRITNPTIRNAHVNHTHESDRGKDICLLAVARSAPNEHLSVRAHPNDGCYITLWNVEDCP